MKKVAVVILNWNGKSWLEKFLPSVLEYTSGSDYEIIMADNGSTDDSIAFTQKYFPSVSILALDENYGFTGGYNRALKLVKATYFVLLNSDIEPSAGWLDVLVKEMDENPEIGACQPKILAFNEQDTFEYAGASGGFIDFLGYPFCRGRIFFTAEKDTQQYNDALDIFWATGACLMIRAELFEKAGRLDEDFFAHMEEIDLCWRLQNLGYSIKVFPKSVVYHVGGGTLNKENPKKTYLNYRNNLALLYKNLPFPSNHTIVFKRMVLDGLAGMHALLKGEYKNTFAILKAHLAFYAWLPSLQSKRKNIAHKKTLKELKGVHFKSIVLQYFLKKKKTFSEIYK